MVPRHGASRSTHQLRTCQNLKKKKKKKADIEDKRSGYKKPLIAAGTLKMQDCAGLQQHNRSITEMGTELCRQFQQ